MTMTMEKPKYEIERNEHTRIANHAYDISKEIKDQESYQLACECLLKVKARLAQWERMVEPVVSAAKKAHTEACELRRQIGEPLKRAEQEILKPALSRYDLAQEKIRKTQEVEFKEQTGMEVVLSSQGKTAGISYKTNWFAKITDMGQLVRGIVDGRININAVSPNMTLINNMAKNFKTGLNWPGVEVKSERVVSARKTYQEEF